MGSGGVECTLHKDWGPLEPQLDFPKISPSPKYKTSLACLGRRGVDTLHQQGLYLRSLPILQPNIPPSYLSWETFLFLPSWGIKPVLPAWEGRREANTLHCKDEQGLYSRSGLSFLPLAVPSSTVRLDLLSA